MCAGGSGGGGKSKYLFWAAGLGICVQDMPQRLADRTAFLMALCQRLWALPGIPLLDNFPAIWRNRALTINLLGGKL